MTKLIPVLLILLLAAVSCRSESTPTALPDPTPAERLVFTPDTPTPVPTPTTPATTAAPATAAPDPTPTPSGSIIQATPTPTPKPTPTIALLPNRTPLPTARPGSTASDPDICRRTPAVQEAILQKLNVQLCAMVSPRELFRFDHEMEFREIGHPDDLAGFDNLKYLGIYGRLDYVNFAHTPSLINIWISEVSEWPEHFSFEHLPPTLERLDISVKGEAACQLFEHATVQQLFDPTADRWDHLTIEISAHIPSSITDDPDLAAVSLGKALGISDSQAFNMWGRKSYENEWHTYTNQEKNRIRRDQDWTNTPLFSRLFAVQISENATCQP